nr:MAG TPA: hypothetical protein [Caudoviricetes sp.]
MRVLRVFRENRKFTIRVCYRVRYMLLVLVVLLCIYNNKGRANKSFFYFLAKINHKKIIPPFYIYFTRACFYFAKTHLRQKCETGFRY